ncbi:MAG: phosphopantetheine-binding protein [Magnetococcus sp. DMHC-6]
MSEMLKTIKEIIRDIMELDSDVGSEENLVEDIGMASVDFIELVVAIEKNFSCEISPNIFAKSMTVFELKQLIESLTSIK